MSMTPTREADRIMSDINITPLIDVMLVLLIIFMVVVPVSRRGLDAALPEPASSRSGDESGAIVVGVDALGMTLNGKAVFTFEALESELRDVVSLRSEKTVFVRASGAVPYWRVVEVVDTARGAGADRIGLITEPEIKPPAPGR